LIKQFKALKINSVFCLQEPGEHALCGDGIIERTGFSYDPEEFFKNGIYFYNFCWKDMTSTPVGYILHVVRLMEFALEGGKKVENEKGFNLRKEI
jgi:hypothetical protein